MAGQAEMDPGLYEKEEGTENIEGRSSTNARDLNLSPTSQKHIELQGYIQMNRNVWYVAAQSSVAPHTLHM
ncbi:hypothetical protein Y1Q_0021666 [Alligator mississippiensis]|uniref:Uncharacterized protein n=1 Tax=Alligator mississippiensis TaxID=8496 RepID=A0A151PAV4_ALLMI|nr:hypothetical protein Y1Q_0021666 [Alligator mississippiensis]